MSQLISPSFWRIISSNRSHIVKLPLSRVRNQSSSPSPASCFTASLCNVTVHTLSLSFLPSPTTTPGQQLKFMHTSHQFLLLSSPPAKEARFRTAKKLYGSTFAFQWVDPPLPPPLLVCHLHIRHKCTYFYLINIIILIYSEKHQTGVAPRISLNAFYFIITIKASDSDLCFSTLFSIEKIPWHTTNQKYYKLNVFSPIMTIQSPNLFRLT